MENVPIYTVRVHVFSYPDKKLEGWNLYRIEYCGPHSGIEKEILVPPNISGKDICDMFDRWQESDKK